MEYDISDIDAVAAPTSDVMFMRWTGGHRFRRLALFVDDTGQETRSIQKAGRR